MRIGVRIAEKKLVGVFVRSDGSYGMHSVAQTGPDSLDGLLLSLRRYASDPTRTSSEPISSIGFDVSAVFDLHAAAPLTVIRIAPRPPVDREHELRDEILAQGSARIVHVAGGHTTIGEAIVPLDTDTLRNVAAHASPGGRYVVTSVGSAVNPAHELEAGSILLELAQPVSVGYSHSFYSSSFAVRERTAVVNSTLVPFAESLVTTLSLIAGKRVPQARLFVTTNDGGRVPLSRLPISPVHSMFAGQPSELVGAASLCDVEDGGVVVTGTRRSFYGELRAGVPAVMPFGRTRQGVKLATQSANLLPVTSILVEGLLRSPTVVATEGASRDLPGFGLEALRRADIDLCALGAASAPLSEWVNRVVIVGSATEMEQALAVSEARVKARLVSFGATPSQVRVVESRAEATTYENSRVVTLRVRAVAPDVRSQVLTGGEPRASQR